MRDLSGSTVLPTCRSSRRTPECWMRSPTSSTRSPQARADSNWVIDWLAGTVVKWHLSAAGTCESSALFFSST